MQDAEFSLACIVYQSITEYEYFSAEPHLLQLVLLAKLWFAQTRQILTKGLEGDFTGFRLSQPDDIGEVHR